MEENGFLHTFTVLTTSASPQLKWLHHRMPVLISDEKLAKQWLKSPSSELLQKISSLASTQSNPLLAWHPVTKKMSSTQYNGKDTILPVKLEELPSIKSFFGKQPLNLKTADKNINRHEKKTTKYSFLSSSRGMKSEAKRSNPFLMSNATSTLFDKKQKKNSFSFFKEEKPSINRRINTKDCKKENDIRSYFKPR